MGWLISRNELTPEQIRAVEFHTGEPRLVVGSPGSGKTMILLHRARHLLDQWGVKQGYQILVFTNVLTTYIRAALQDLGLDEDRVMTFDKWCSNFYKQHINKSLPFAGKRPDFEAIRHAAWNAVTSPGKRLQLPLYDFVMIDEGQDLDIQAYQTLKCIAAHVTVFMDHKQQLYENGARERDILSALGLRKRNIQLLSAYRCSPYIVHAAAAFVRDPMEREAFIKQNPPIDKGERQIPLFYLADSFEDERAKLVDIVRTRIDKGERIAILFPSNKLSFVYARHLQDEGLEVEVNVQRPKSNMLSIDFSSSRPKLMAYPSAKGLTVDAVLMPCLNLNRFSIQEEKRLEQWLFVGITRATKWVYLSAKNGNDVLFRGHFDELQNKKRLAFQHYEKSTPKPAKVRMTETDDLSNLF